MQVFIEDGERFVYLDTAFAYNWSKSSDTVYSQVKVCLHDAANAPQQYFLQGNYFFWNEWMMLKDHIYQTSQDKEDFEFSIVPLSSVGDKAKDSESTYKLQYDMDLFDSYDGKPVKVYRMPLIKTCDVFAGEYFMSR